MNAPRSAASAYAASAEELAWVLGQADHRIEMARESLDAVHQGVSRSLVALGDVEIEVRKGERGVGQPFVLQEAFEDLRRRSERASRDAGDVREHLGHTRGALAAGQVLLAGMPAPGTEQERVDQDAMHTRLQRLHDTIDRLLPVAEDLRDRTWATGELATVGRDRAHSDPAEVLGLTEDVGRSRTVADGLGDPVEAAGITVHGAAAQAQAVATAARLCATQTTAHPAGLITRAGVLR